MSRRLRFGSVAASLCGLAALSAAPAAAEVNPLRRPSARAAAPAPAVAPAAELGQHPDAFGSHWFAGGARAEPLGAHQRHWQVMAGVRTSYLTAPGFDPFADSNELVQGSFGASRTLLAADRLSFAATGWWDFGSREATARGEPTQAVVHRLALGPEARWHFLPGLYGFARAAPALVYLQASLSESSSGAVLYSCDAGWLDACWWRFGVDATAGAAFEVLGKPSGASSMPRIWLAGEGGHGWALAHDLHLRPDAEDGAAPQRVADLDLGALAVRGWTFRISAAMSF